MIYLDIFPYLDGVGEASPLQKEVGHLGRLGNDGLFWSILPAKIYSVPLKPVGYRNGMHAN